MMDVKNNRYDKRVLANIIVEFQVGKYRIKTVDSQHELDQALKLRYQVFMREFQGKWLPFGKDRDAYDDLADHLIAIDTENNKVVGTYRLICSKFSDKFYSETEFNVQKFLENPEIKVELGRACIHKDYRNGIVLSALWRGIRDYWKKSRARYLFGCSSIKSRVVTDGAVLYNYFLDNNWVDHQFEIEPLATHLNPGLKTVIPMIRDKHTSHHHGEALMPSLLRSYIKQGAKIAGLPAYDADFGCFDFLTVIDRDETKLARAMTRVSRHLEAAS